MSYCRFGFVLLLLCGMLFIISCGAVAPDFSDVFERAFDASMVIQDGEREYKASISMSALSDIDTSVADATNARNGSVRYLSPDSISDITARRENGVVTIGVSGIEITPSPSISEKYVTLLNWLDLRGNMIYDASKRENDSTTCYEVEYITESGNVSIIYDYTTKLPISLSIGNIKITFTEFVYT